MSFRTVRTLKNKPLSNAGPADKAEGFPMREQEMLRLSGDSIGQFLEVDTYS